MFKKLINKFAYLIKKIYWHKTHTLYGGFIELSAYISNSHNIVLGKGSYISRKTVIINDYGKVVLGDNAHIAPTAYINCYKANLYCGNNVNISSHCSIIAHSTKRNHDGTFGRISKDIIIGNNVLIGANAVVLPGVKIGAGSTIGAGAVVTKNIPPNVVAIGCPARPKLHN